MTKHTCGFSASMRSLPFVTILSPIIFFFHLCSVSLPLGSCLDQIQTHHFGFDGTSCLFYEHLRWLQIPVLPLTVS